MHIIPIKTKIFTPPKDTIYPTLQKLAKKLREKDIVAITSKVVSIGEGRCIPIGTEAEKVRLVRREADAVFELRGQAGEKGVMHTIKDSTVVAWAGIDESNADGHWILWPKDATASAKAIWNFLRKETKLNELGVVITDSHFNPLRAGAVGISTARRGSPDKHTIEFSRPLQDY